MGLKRKHGLLGKKKNNRVYEVWGTFRINAYDEVEHEEKRLTKKERDQIFDETEALGNVMAHFGTFKSLDEAIKCLKGEEED